MAIAPIMPILTDNRGRPCWRTEGDMDACSNSFDDPFTHSFGRRKSSNGRISDYVKSALNAFATHPLAGASGRMGHFLRPSAIGLQRTTQSALHRAILETTLESTPILHKYL